MTPDPHQPITVSRARLDPLLAQATKAGIEIGPLLKSLSLPAALAEATGPDRIDLADYYRLQNRLSILFGDETVHLSSRQLLSGSTDFVLQNVHDCDNLYEVMRVLARSYNMLHGGQYNSVVKRRASVDIIINDRDFPYVDTHSAEFIYFSIECVLIFLHCILLIVSPSAKDAVKSVFIRRPSPGGDCAHLGYWDAPIRFAADKYRLSFDLETSLRPITMPQQEALTSNAVYQKIVDVVAGRTARREAPKSTTSLVRDALSRGVVEQADLAAQMNVSVATLRRRLGLEGGSFRELRREVLNEEAQRLLLSEKSVADVSDALGFSEFRAFNRAFKDWNGLTPKAFIKEALERKKP
ncbi:helix-turn-helix domain-containing protein [Hyphococcus flavus]|uniref:Helix-turn-helix domain-containing protein n=1 Tax=Hyphococcus flavus TaxID=1866326 RepID=A0AAE9ZGY2_9PROT|nr:helix-turn-helix domain-containing protein [Hyphococcus flavus]WDI32347.1 helix-turn-helix domain-containing protein [Hyphococcus flavus]